jgi:hypothetical protein
MATDTSINDLEYWYHDPELETGATDKAWNHTEKSVGVKTAESLGGHVMHCEEDKYQLDVGMNTTLCFDSFEEAEYYALEWIDNHPEAEI